MTSCDAYVLSRYLDGELLLRERLDVERHLRACSSCREELQALRQVNRMLVNWGAGRLPVPLGTEKRILRAVEGRRHSQRRFAVSRMASAAVGSSIAALLVLMSANFGRFEQPAPGATSSGYASAVQRTINKQELPLVASRRTSAILGGPGVAQTETQVQSHVTPRLD